MQAILADCEVISQDQYDLNDPGTWFLSQDAHKWQNKTRQSVLHVLGEETKDRMLKSNILLQCKVTLGQPSRIETAGEIYRLGLGKILFNQCQSRSIENHARSWCGLQLSSRDFTCSEDVVSYMKVSATQGICVKGPFLYQTSRLKCWSEEAFTAFTAFPREWHRDFSHLNTRALFAFERN